jgi:hypothetical protein
MKRNRNKDKMKYPEIAVFALKSGSQVRDISINSRSYEFVMKMFDIMMKKNNVWSSKIGFGSTREDMGCFLSGIIEMYLHSEIELDLMSDINEYDPDFLNSFSYKTKSSFN